MNNPKVWMLITGVILIASGAMIYSLMRTQQTEKNAAMVKMQEMATQINILEKVKEEKEKLTAEKTEMEAKFQAEINSLESQITDSKKNESSLRAKVESLTREKESLTKYIENNNQIVAKLNKKIESLEKAKNEAQKRVKQAEEESAAAPVVSVDPMDESDSSAVLDASTGSAVQGAKLVQDEVVDLGRILVHPSTNEAARVEHVNVLYGFIVLSAGTSDGLRKDTVVNITRNNRLVAKAVIKKARENVSSAVTLPEWTREEIRVGDMISVNSPSPLPL